jgi:acetyl esterase/lipase
MFSHDGPYSQTLRSCSRRLLFVGAMAACVVVSAMSGCTGNAAAAGDADTYRVEADVLYRTTDDLTESARGRCRLDVYYPTNTSGYATVVWFHGGGLTSGERFIPEELKRQGIAVVAANYRLAPDAASPTYIEDAAAAVAWTLRNIERFGGSAERVIVSGHSAGGYLAAMIGLDKRWLAAHDIDADCLAGIAPYSGHAITHFTIRKERGIPGTQPVVDDLAPLFHVRKDAPPILLVTGDRDMELLGRYEETAYLWRMLKEAGHEKVELFELEGYNHGQMAGPAHPLLLRFIQGL